MKNDLTIDNTTPPIPTQQDTWVEVVAVLAETYDQERRKHLSARVDRTHRSFTLRIAKNLYMKDTPVEILRPAIARMARKQLPPLMLYRVVGEVQGDCLFSDDERRHAKLSDLMRCDCRKCAQESVRQSPRPELET